MHRALLTRKYAQKNSPVFQRRILRWLTRVTDCLPQVRDANIEALSTFWSLIFSAYFYKKQKLQRCFRASLAWPISFPTIPISWFPGSLFFPAPFPAPVPAPYIPLESPLELSLGVPLGLKVIHLHGDEAIRFPGSETPRSKMAACYL